jgi:glycosyltransferase involved in cell wall biosynthesis
MGAVTNLKILQVLPFFTPARGGSVTVPYALSKELAKRGHNITIIASDFEFDAEYAKSIESYGVKVVVFPCVVHLGLFLYSPKMKKWLRENIKKFDIIHMHNFRSYQNNIVHTYAKLHGVPYLVQAHGSVLPFFQKQNLKKVYDWVWGNKILRDATKVIAITNTEAEQYRTMGVNENKIEIVPNGIDLSEFENLPKRGRFRKKYGIGDDEKIVLYLGRIHKIKGIDILVESFADLAKELDKVRLVIVGPDDGYLETIKNKISTLSLEEKITITGPMYGVDKLGAYVDADVYVLPSIYEVWSITALEAIMCRTQIIITNDCGCSEIVKNSNCGYLVKYSDVNDLKEKIKFALGNSEEVREMVNRGKQYIEENLNWGSVAKKIESSYTDSTRKI